MGICLKLIWVKGLPSGKPKMSEASINLGQLMGFEPTNTGTTIRGLNHLATATKKLAN